VNEKGIFFRMTDSNRRILIDLSLYSDKFNNFKFKDKEKIISVGLNLSHFYKMLKNIKKKDNLVLFIEENKEELGIQVIPKDKNRITTSYIKIQNLQSLEIDIDDNYKNPINIPSNEYIKMIKDLNNTGSNMITISSLEGILKLNCNTNHIYSREIIYGETDDKNIKFRYTQDFDIEQLYRISKISGLSTLIQLYQNEDLPLLITSNVSNLGKISIYIKDKKRFKRRLKNKFIKKLK
jgi:hypothetical protein